jgi:hypothetical protein
MRQALSVRDPTLRRSAEPHCAGLDERGAVKSELSVRVQPSEPDRRAGTSTRLAANQPTEVRTPRLIAQNLDQLFGPCLCAAAFVARHDSSSIDERATRGRIERKAAMSAYAKTYRPEPGPRSSRPVFCAPPRRWERRGAPSASGRNARVHREGCLR